MSGSEVLQQVADAQKGIELLVITPFEDEKNGVGRLDPVAQIAAINHLDRKTRDLIKGIQTLEEGQRVEDTEAGIAWEQLNLSIKHVKETTGMGAPDYKRIWEEKVALYNKVMGLLGTRTQV